jgi:hypothetical protein
MSGCGSGGQSGGADGGGGADGEYELADHDGLSCLGDVRLTS